MNSVYAMSEEEAANERIRLQLLADLHRSRLPLPESFSPEDAAIDAGAVLQRTAEQVIVICSNAWGVPEPEAAEMLASLDFPAAAKRMAA